MIKEKIMCSNCILDSEIPNIEFDDKGVCNYCHLLQKLDKDSPVRELNDKYFQKKINQIKYAGKNKKYDCIIGVSGGVDSTYVLYLAVKLGLRPLAVHCDNGWNSELAVSNIKNMLNILNIDLYTYVINWNEFKELQKAFFKASVPDIETLTDNANSKVLYQTASKHNIKYIIKGNNFRTEGIIPRGWTYFDKKYFNYIRKKFSNVRVKNYPLMTLFHHIYYRKFKRIEFFKILNHVDYNKKNIVSLIENELNWRNYGGKHFESIFTRFFQSYILLDKFNIDKRKVHLSALICSKQLTREEALNEIKKPPYPKDLIKEDIKYICKKWGMNEKEFHEIFKYKPKTFKDYPNQFLLISLIKKIRSFFNKGVHARP